MHQSPAHSTLAIADLQGKESYTSEINRQNVSGDTAIIVARSPSSLPLLSSHMHPPVKTLSF